MAITDAYAESVIALVTGQDVKVSLHTADPGETGANEAAVTSTNGRQDVLSVSGWDAAVDHVATGGRSRANAADINFGNAPSNETVTHFALWESDNTTYIGGWALTSSRALIATEPVRFPAGALLIVGASG